MENYTLTTKRAITTKINLNAILSFVFHLLTGLLFSSFSIGEYAPFTAPIICAVWIRQTKSLLPTLLGAALGAILISKNPASILQVGIVFLFTSLFALCGRKKNLNSTEKLIICSFSQLFAIILFNLETVYSCLTGLAFCAVGIISAIVFINSMQGIAIVRERSRMLLNQEQLMLFIFIGLALLSIYSLPVIGISLYGIISILLTLILTYVCGLAGITAAFCITLSVILSGETPSLIIVLCLPALCTCIFFPQRKLLHLLTFFTVFAVIACIIKSNITYIQAIISGLIFFLFPDSLLKKYGACLSEISLPDSIVTGKNETVLRVLEVLSDYGGKNSNVIKAICHALCDERRITPSENENYRLELASAGSSKYTKIPSGDSLKCFEFEQKSCVILSDGMGTGLAAQQKSDSAIAIEADLLLSGFDPITATECTNALLLREETVDIYATLDLMLFDKATANAKLIKSGAPPAIVMRGNKAYAACLEALPLGIVEEAVPASCNLKLKEGDTVIMMTDGITDVFGSGLIACISEAISIETTAKGIASYLLKSAQKCGAIDDMSIVVARVCENTR